MAAGRLTCQAGGPLALEHQWTMGTESMATGIPVPRSADSRPFTWVGSACGDISVPPVTTKIAFQGLGRLQTVRPAQLPVSGKC
jgi:hypothetical protein